MTDRVSTGGTSTIPIRRGPAQLSRHPGQRQFVHGEGHPPYGQLLSLGPRIELAKLADHIEQHDTDHRLFTFLYDQSLEQNRHFLDRYRGGDRRGVVFYAAAIRHIYVHGHLTAHPSKCTAANLIAICDAPSEIILDLITACLRRADQADAGGFACRLRCASVIGLAAPLL